MGKEGGTIYFGTTMGCPDIDVFLVGVNVIGMEWGRDVERKKNRKD